MNRKNYMDNFVSAYVECLIWTSTNEHGEPIPSDTTISDAKSVEISAECEAFFTDNAEILLTVEPWASNPGQAGHDFCLTRNGHGAGFWDRGAGEPGEKLSSAAHVWGEDYIMV